MAASVNNYNRKVMFAVVAMLAACMLCHGSKVAEDDITHVHMVFMNHLDVGYSLPKEKGYVINVLNTYFHEYFPRAVTVSLQLEGLKYAEQLVYTTHAWLVSLYLDCPVNLELYGRKLVCPSDKDVAGFEAAVKRGYITWHAGPMNMEMEMMDQSMLEFSIQLGIDLDKRFGIDRQHRTLSQRDVPGTTQAIIPTLEKMGIEAISIGVNGATVPAAVPSVFNWKFGNSSVMVMYHPGGYPKEAGQLPFMPGGLSRHDCHIVPGFSHALCFAFRSDNTGPPMDYKEVLSNYEVARSQFPNAIVKGSTFEAFTAELVQFKEKLPVVTQEIGDVWIQGSQSDPWKVQMTRWMYKMRAECIRTGECSLTDPSVYAASRYMLKLSEHTWGLAGNCVDNIHWTNDQFRKLLQNTTGQFGQAEDSWGEQLSFLFLAMNVLGDHVLAKKIRQNWPSHLGHLPQKPEGYSNIDGNSFECGGFTLTFGPDGSLIQLTDPQKQEWASESNPIGQLAYRTYNQSDFDKFFAATMPYSKSFFLGIGKPNMTKNASPVSRVWPTVLKSLLGNKKTCSVIAEIAFKDTDQLEYYGPPRSLYINYTIDTQSNAKPGVDMLVIWGQKKPTRLPEEMSIIFSPTPRSNYRWMMNKINELVDPMNVATNGSQLLHAVNSGVYYTDSMMKGLEIVSVDTGLVNIITEKYGVTTIPFPGPTLTKMTGVAFNLFNNVWETNYIFWLPYMKGTDPQFYRFRLNMQT